MLRFRSLRLGVLCLVFALSAARGEAGSVTLAWNASPGPGVLGYTLVFGTQSGQYSGSFDVGARTEYTVSTLPDGTYYFVVQAYTAQGLTSGFSNEVAATIVTPTSGAPAGCTTPDPFASLGGGTCYNGGWLPPGMPVPSAPSPSTPAPATPTPPSASCTTPDPFASMGGGTCYNGGWLPPGMPVPAGASTFTPTPAGPSTFAPAPAAPAPSAVPCTTPDPFVALGGGTCYNGGWLPPGMPVPAGPSTYIPPTTSAPASGSMGPCATPDPFVSLGGGTCYNGGWLPPGMPIPKG